MASETHLDTASEAERTAHVRSLMDRLVAKSPIYNMMVSTMSLVSASKGTVRTRLTMLPVHLNSRGGLHGAVTATIVDFTTGLALASWDLRASTGASVDMHISYLSAAAEGDEVEVIATAERVGGAVSFVTIRIVKVGDEGRVIAIAQHTKYLRPKAAVAGQ